MLKFSAPWGVYIKKVEFEKLESHLLGLSPEHSPFNEDVHHCGLFKNDHNIKFDTNVLVMHQTVQIM